MKQKKYIKDITEITIGASIMPSYSKAIDAADMGTLGKAAKDIGMVGFVSKTGKKLKVI